MDEVNGPIFETLHVLFQPKDVTTNNFNQLNIRVIGVICGKTAYSYKTLSSKFGLKTAIGVKPNDCRKVNKSKNSQLLAIDITESKFIDKNGNEVIYHNSSIIDAKNKIINSLLESYNTFVQTQVDELDDDIEIL
jgi:hypothetical protein